MVGQKDYFALFGNGHRDNKIFTLNAGESMTLNFKSSGADTASNKYYDLKSEAKKVMIRVSNISTITHIGNQELSSPITLGTAAANTFSTGIEWSKITVVADSDTTTFEVYGS